jgi:hypothetical protein
MAEQELLFVSDGWATWEYQNRNKKSSHVVVFKNEKRYLAELCEIYKIRQDTAIYRLKSGWSIEDIFLIPVRKLRKKCN